MADRLDFQSWRRVSVSGIILCQLRMLCRLLVDVKRYKFWPYLQKSIPPIVTKNDSLVDSTDIGDDIWRRTGGIRYI